MSEPIDRQILTPGCFARLRRSSTANGLFQIIALDHQDSLKAAINPIAPEGVTRQEIINFKQDVAEILGDTASGILLDAPTGIPAVMEGGLHSQCNWLVAIERSDYALQPLPIELEIEPGWNVAKISQLGAVGVKLFLYDKPSEQEITASQNAIIEQIAADCHCFQIPLFSEPIVIVEHPEEDFTECVIHAAQRQQGLGATVLKLEFPVQNLAQHSLAEWREACSALSAALDIPWVLLSAGVDFATFARQLEVACEEGASGFIVGRALWGEATGISNSEERYTWLQKVAKPRLQMLAAIANGKARPWSDFYTTAKMNAGWFHK